MDNRGNGQFNANRQQDTMQNNVFPMNMMNRMKQPNMYQQPMMMNMNPMMANQSNT